jgi:hypothetical protein
MLAVFVERFGAYGLLGFLFRLAYPSRIGLAWVLVLGRRQMTHPTRPSDPNQLAKSIVDIATGGSQTPRMQLRRPYLFVLAK